MSMQRFLGSVEELGEREVGVIVATNQLARDGHVLEPSGIDLTNYRKNPIVLWQHTPDQPVGIATAIGLQDGELAARIEFAPAGVSDLADQLCALVKSGIVRGVSAGFDPTEMEPLDPAKGSRGGLRFLEAELLEISFCAVPVDTGATVVARSFATPAQAIAAFRALPAVPRAAVERAAARLPSRGHKLLSHSGHVWALQQLEREKRQRYSCEQRRARLEELKAIGEAYAARRH